MSTNTASTPEPEATRVSPLSSREQERHNQAYRLMHGRAASQLNMVEGIEVYFSNVIDSDGPPAPAPVSPASRVVDPIDDELQRTGVNDATTVQALSSGLRSLMQEHTHNRNENWFEADGRQRYIEARDDILVTLQNMLRKHCWSGLGAAADLSPEISTLLTLTQVTIHRNGDIPGDTELVDPVGAERRLTALCNALDQLALHMRTETQQARQRVNAPASAATTPAPGPTATTTLDTNDFVSGEIAARYMSISQQLQEDLPQVVAEEFWMRPDLRVQDTDISALAISLQREAARLRPVRGQPQGTLDATAVNDLHSHLQELILAMRNQLSIHRNRPNDVRMEIDEEPTRRVVAISSGVRSAVGWLIGTRLGRKTALVGTLAGAVSMGLWSLNSGDSESEPQNKQTETAVLDPVQNQQTAVPANSAQQQVPATTGQTPGTRLTPSNAPAVPELDIGPEASVHREGDTLVFALPERTVFQLWVGLRGGKPIRITPIEEGGKHTYNLPDEYKGKDVGVIFQTFNATTRQWERNSPVGVPK